MAEFTGMRFMSSVMFGPVVGQIGRAGSPLDLVLTLVDLITNPVKAHVHSFELCLLYCCVVGNPVGGRVVGSDVGGCLRPVEFGECGAKRDSVFSVDEAATEFCFCSGGDNLFEYARGIEDVAVVGDFRIWQFVAEVEVARGTTAGLQFTEVAGIAVNLQLHVTGVEADFGIEVAGAIVKEHGEFRLCVGGGVGLFGCKK